MAVLNGLFFCLALIGFLATLPGTLELALLTLGAICRRTPVAYNTQIPPGYRLAVVIPAHNEEALIARCISSVRASAQSMTGCAVIVVADNCTDTTAHRAQEAGARVLLRQDADHKGKGYALRFAFEKLLAEPFDGLLIVDADSVVSANLVSETVRLLDAGAAASQCRYRVADNAGSRGTGLMELALLAFNVLRPRGRARLGLSAGNMGNGFAVRRETLLRIPYTAGSIVEDLEYHLILVSGGGRVQFADQATVYGEIPSAYDAALTQRSRWEGGRMRMAFEWIPRLVFGVLSGNGRLLEPLMDLMTLPLAFHCLLLLVPLILPVHPFREYAIAALSVVVGHVLMAASLGGDFIGSISMLAAAPFYIVWKFAALGSILESSRKGADWVRTRRDRSDFGGEVTVSGVISND